MKLFNCILFPNKLDKIVVLFNIFKLLILTLLFNIVLLTNKLDIIEILLLVKLFKLAFPEIYKLLLLVKL